MRNFYIFIVEKRNILPKEIIDDKMAELGRPLTYLVTSKCVRRPVPCRVCKRPSFASYYAVRCCEGKMGNKNKINEWFDIKFETRNILLKLVRVELKLKTNLANREKYKVLQLFYNPNNIDRTIYRLQAIFSPHCDQQKGILVQAGWNVCGEKCSNRQ